jgi:hypothetical protein
LPSDDANDPDPDDNGEPDDDDIKSEWVDDDKIPHRPSCTPNPRHPICDGNGPPDGGSDDRDDSDGNGDDDEDFLPDPSEVSSNSTTRGPIFNCLASALDHIAQSYNKHSAPITTNKACLPDTFSGSDPNKLKTFLFQCQLYFQSNPNHFSRERAKVDFAMTFLTDIPLSWFESAIDQEDAGVVFPWSTNFTLFAAELHLHFGISDPKGVAAEAIENLKMKPSNKMAVYNVEFMKYAGQLSWGNEILCYCYYKGLPNCLQDPLSTRKQGKPTTFQEMYHITIVFDNHYWEHDRKKAHA